MLCLELTAHAPLRDNAMTSYIIRRLGIGVITLLLITFLVYGLVRNMPGTPFTSRHGADESRAR